MTGVITIEDTNPDMVQMILEVIYLGGEHLFPFPIRLSIDSGSEDIDTKFWTETRRLCSTPSEIIEIWKTGDFFRIPEVTHAAWEAMHSRIKASCEFLRFNPEPKSKPPRPDNNGCSATTVVYDRCGHSVYERRACPVGSVRPISVFHLCEPGATHRDRMCGLCQLRTGDFSCLSDRPQQDQGVTSPTRSPSPVLSARPGFERREMIEDEIWALGKALVFATAETPQGSAMQMTLVNHICNTRVAAWGGFTVCRFLEP